MAMFNQRYTHSYMYLLIITRSIHNFLIQACIQFNNHINEDTFISFFPSSFTYTITNPTNTFISSLPCLSISALTLSSQHYSCTNSKHYLTIFISHLQVGLTHLIIPSFSHMHLILTTTTFTPLFNVGYSVFPLNFNTIHTHIIHV